MLGRDGGSGDYTTESYYYDPNTATFPARARWAATAMEPNPAAAWKVGWRPVHAVVTTVGTTTTTYCYDRNGNMTRRDPSGTPVYNFQYNAENQMTGVSGTHGIVHI